MQLPVNLVPLKMSATLWFSWMLNLHHWSVIFLRFLSATSSQWSNEVSNLFDNETRSAIEQLSMSILVAIGCNSAGKEFFFWWQFIPTPMM